MIDNKQSHSHHARARRLAEALRPATAAGDSACPDAELLAAYADHNLDAAETARWEEHFAGCARCQDILAVLTVSAEEPLGGAEVERFDRRVAAATASASDPEPRGVESKRVAPVVRPRTAWRWVAPVVGIAAAAALWIALRPAPPRGTAANTAQNTSVPPSGLGARASGGQASGNQPSATPDDSQMAQTEVPPPPAAVARGVETRQLKSPALAEPEVQLQAQAQAKKSEEAADATPAPPPAAPEAAGAAGAAGLQGGSGAAAVPGVNSPEAQSARELAATPPAPTAVVPAARQAPAPAPASGEAAATTQQRPLQAFAARGIAGGIAGAVAPPPLTFASPGGNVRWRIGPGGRVARSTDQAQNWAEQTSGVTSDLLAGSAPSDRVAWIAGRAGVVLRTIDGEHWQRVASPAGVIDWTGIAASDALHATVVADRRRFVTEDGGQTWKQQ